MELIKVIDYKWIGGLHIIKGGFAADTAWLPIQEIKAFFQGNQDIKMYR